MRTINPYLFPFSSPALLQSVYSASTAFTLQQSGLPTAALFPQAVMSLPANSNAVLMLDTFACQFAAAPRPNIAEPVSVAGMVIIATVITPKAC